MTAIRKSQSLKAAEELCTRYSENGGLIEQVEAERNAAIAAANSKADAELAPLIEEQDKIAAKLEPWWDEQAPKLTEGKRKSIELGGCIIGTRSGRASLSVAGKPAEVIDQLKSFRWAKPLLRVTTSLDRIAALKALDGPHGDELRKLGLSLEPARETFVLDRAEQRGTLGKS